MSSPTDFFARFYADKALDDANELIDWLSTTDEVEFGDVWVKYDFLLGHLCVSWHWRNLGPDEMSSRSRDEYVELTLLIPNWNNRFRIVQIPIEVCSKDGKKFRFGAEIDSKRMAKEIFLGIQFLQDLVNGNDYLNAIEEEALEHALAETLSGMCLAWHLSHLTPKTVAMLDETARGELSGLIPDLNGYTLVPAHEANPNG